MVSPARRNHLAAETSPYLLQHADNPVDWHPWSESALALAREQDKPILLSIGYSACHWCHVMAHESFEDAATGELMNRLFVNIKVDREERPDLDKIYQLAHAALTRRAGGWPLTMFLSPHDLMPFFGGTYFPNEPRHGLPAFGDLLEQIESAYREKQSAIRDQGRALREFFDSLTRAPGSGGAGPSADAVRSQAREELLEHFDARYGGFGTAPKFPQPTHLQRALRQWQRARRTGKADAALGEVWQLSLRRMAEGGIYDHLGGGFCRYSTDAQWMIPHFEKMLYDNALLLGLYAQAYAATGDALYARVALDTGRWVMREMQAPEGGYYSTLDADSEGHEGRYYLWRPEQVKALLPETEWTVFERRFGLDRTPNFEGQWHLHGYTSVAELSAELGLAEAELLARLDAAGERLLAARERRVRPGRDEKVLTAWNGLMIRAMALAARLLEHDEFADSARRAAEFATRQLWDGERLLATYKDGRARFNGYLDDYAFLLDGLLELLRLRWDSRWLSLAVELAEALLARFEDKAAGGFFFTSDDHESLIHRPKPFTDEAMPSGNGMAAAALLELGYLLAEPRYLRAAEAAVAGAAEQLRQSSLHHASLVDAVDWLETPPPLVVVRAPEQALPAWREACRGDPDAEPLLFAVPAEAADLPTALADKPAPPAGRAYLCRGLSCAPPIDAPDELAAALRPAPPA